MEANNTLPLDLARKAAVERYADIAAEASALRNRPALETAVVMLRLNAMNARLEAARLIEAAELAERHIGYHLR